MPVDPQVEGMPAVSLLKVIQQKPIEDIDDETLVLADVAEKGLAQVVRAVRELLVDHMTPERAEELTKTLTSGRWTHDYAITADEALELGLPVRTDMPSEILDLLSLYPQPIRAIPSVEYLPTPQQQPSGSGR
jgi:ClpP class serine protease